jgi:hypothetical protein
VHGCFVDRQKRRGQTLTLAIRSHLKYKWVLYQYEKAV